jgi:hypothetical protein
MRKYLLLLCLTVGGAQPAYATQIVYDATNLGGNTWEYVYTVHNDTLASAIDELTIFFDLLLYENLAVAAAPAGWDAIAVQPDPGLPDAGFYDALALGGGIGAGEILTGFSVRFDFLGAGAPAGQAFAIVDPVSFAVVESGTTQQAAAGVPEPGTIAVLGVGLLLLPLARRMKAAPRRPPSSFAR